MSLMIPRVNTDGWKTADASASQRLETTGLDDHERVGKKCRLPDFLDPIQQKIINWPWA
jgi:hypothetical protein